MFYKYFLILNGCCVNYRQAYQALFNLIVTSSSVRMKFTIIAAVLRSGTNKEEVDCPPFGSLEELKVTVSRSPSEFLSSCVTEPSSSLL